MSRTVVVGLDGASWDLLDPWIENGELPNLAALRAASAYAETESCLPPVTFPNWKCYSSGKNPGKFGVFWFERVNLEAGTIDVTNGGDFETPELWDYLNDAGKRAGVVNMPTMYPPRDIDGPIVAGGPDAVEGEYRSIDGGYATPAGLAEELEERFDYRVHPDPLLSSNEERGAEVEAILELLELRFEVALTLLEEEDLEFVHVTLFYLNVLQHFFWNDEPTRRAYGIIDEWVGRIAGMDDTNLVLMSDHGCGPTTTEFYINEWLAENGYQARERTVDGAFQRIGLDREHVLAVAKRLGAVDLLASVVPERIQKLVPQSAGLKRDRKLDAVDLAETRALASGQGPIYLNPAFDRESVREDLIADLRTVTDEYGPIFDGVHRAEDVYDGPFLGAPSAPDVVVDQRDGVHVNDGIGGGTVRSGPDRWRAENTRNGIFLASGPDFEAAGELDRISILDMAPTLLTAAGCAVPSDMDGDPLPIVAGDPEPATREPIAWDRGDEDDVTDGVEERLTQLGYME
ncbi:Predicted phosphohydrolase or phosphomutase, AlkP superfamily [Halopenitus malekzadehii]|uniref:Predicted phosphohydrolase or phosphomutase, AlkP superfamily n=1 Tax=Halopenitus malekzadehii TaxID=1267564 RepID=A0A1H6IHT5_9EURY|nr:alkaline phosphatase family protein [Halopenitus malekzadehii]SEH46474.1 Predicted phosphohydrolase or phosphomutase, AlkP superfamily [Halopenitus malekzadehii]